MKFDLKNTSQQPVSAIIVATPDNVTHSIDYFGEDHLRPGAIQTLTVSTAEGDRVLKILAVVFADGSAEGLPRPLEFLKAKRLGRALETKRLSSIYAALPPEQAESEAGIDSLSRKVGPLPNTPGEALASVRDVRLPAASAANLQGAGREVLFAFLAGVRQEREDAVRELSQLRQLSAPTVKVAEGVRAHALSASIAAQTQRYEQLSSRQQRELEALK